MHPEIIKLIRLQQIEDQIRFYTERINLLPCQLAVLEEKLQKSLLAQQSHKDQGGKLGTEKRKCESAIQDLEQKISKYKGQLFDVKNNEQYRALLNEIEFTQQEIRKIEDDILLKMELEEKIKTESIALETQLRQEKNAVEAEKKSAREEVEKDKGLLQELTDERQKLNETIPAELLTQYNRIASYRKGVALARVIQETCQGCNVRVRPQIFSELLRGDIIHTCDNCSRILYYQPETPYEVSEN